MRNSEHSRSVENILLRRTRAKGLNQTGRRTVSNCGAPTTWKSMGCPFSSPHPVVDILFIAREKTHGLDVTRKIPAIAVKTRRYLRARISLVAPSSRSPRHASNAIVGRTSSRLGRFAAREFCRSSATRDFDVLQSDRIR